MKIIKWSSPFLISLLLFGCGKKEIIGTEKILAQSRIVSPFTSVNVSGYYNVNITVGNPQSIVVKVNGNLLPYIETVVKSKTLMVQSKKGYLLRPQGIPEINIVARSLTEINLSGNNHATLKNYRGDDLDLNFSGTNQLIGQGVVNSFTMELSGDTVIETRGLIANKVNIDSSGNSKIAVSAKEHLKISISGNGVVNYSGSPKITQTINGSGTISKAQETINK